MGRDHIFVMSVSLSQGCPPSQWRLSKPDLYANADLTRDLLGGKRNTHLNKRDSTQGGYRVGLLSAASPSMDRTTGKMASKFPPRPRECICSKPTDWRTITSFRPGG